MENNKLFEKYEREIETLKQQLVVSEKLASVGYLTAGILHEIRNPLSFVLNFSKLSIDLIDDLRQTLNTLPASTEQDTLDELADLSTMLQTNIQKVIENSARAERIIQNMLAQTSTIGGNIQPTDVNLLLEESVKLAYHGVRGNDKTFNVRLTFALDNTITTVRIAPIEFSRVIINLVNNACYAVNQKKQNTHIPYTPEITTTTQITNNQLTISIKDNGIGLSPQVREKLFTPFFTTKPVGQGTGLGLSMSLDIIRHLHKGTVEINSIEGQFTEFIIRIPV